MKKRILAIVLSVLMLLSAAPLVTVSAALLGDADLDGKLSASDARIALRASVNLETLSGEAKTAADADMDGKISAADARLILRASVGLENLHSHSYTEAVTTPATCEGKGVKTFTCSCGDSYTEEIAATGHKSVTDVAVEATCTAEGKTEGAHCSVCNKILKAQSVAPKKAHTLVTDKAVSATCTKTGLTEGSHCSVCNTVIKSQTRVEATGHKKSTLDASTVIAATCKADGYTGDYKCDVCGTVTKKGTKVASTGAEHVLREKTVEASCTTDEYTVMACIHCDYFDSTTVVESGKKPNGIGHDYGTMTTVAASCGKGGYDTETCSVCEYEHKTNFTDALEHDYKVTKRVRATCLATGYEEQECKLCKEKRTVTLGIAAHKPGEKENVTGAKGGADCYSVVKCSVCGEVLSTASNAGSHILEKVKDSDVPETCTTSRTQIMACTICDYSYVQHTSDALGHSNISDDRKTPTCDEDGYMIITGKCTRCGEGTGADNKIILPAKGHVEAGVQTCTTDVKCLVCGKVTKPRFGHSYTKKSDAIKGKDNIVDTFFCTRCGEACGDKDDAAKDKEIKLKTFNAVTDKIKTAFYSDYDYEINKWPTFHSFGKLKTETTYTEFNFGIYTSMIEDMYKEEMGETPDDYIRITKPTVKSYFPLDGRNEVSLLTASDIDSITVERLSGADFNSILSAFNTKYTVGKTEYDLTPYKSVRVNENVIRVTVDVKNEKYYGGIQNLTEAEKTSLQKIFDIDVRDDLREFSKDGKGKLYITESEKSDGYEMSMTMYLDQLSTDGKVVYYFLESTYEPIIAVYDAYETMEQSINMSFKIGLNIKGTMAPVIKSQKTTVFVFPEYIPQ